MPRKSSFCYANLVARKESIWPPIFFPSFFLLFRFGFLNWVRCKPVGPRRERGGWESESLRVFNTRQKSGNGTRELRTGSRPVPQYGIRIRDRGPALPAVAIWKWEACATARSVPRGSDACHNCSVALSLRAPVQERSPCPSALLLELRPNALLPEFIRSSASLRIRRRSSVWRIASWFPRSSMALSRRSGFGTCANKLKRPLDFDTSLFHTLSRQATVAPLFSSPDFLSRKWRVRIASGDLLPPSPPAEKATARQDQPWKSCADDGGGDCQEYPPRCGHDLSGEQNSYFDCY